MEMDQGFEVSETMGEEESQSRVKEENRQQNWKKIDALAAKAA